MGSPVAVDLDPEALRSLAGEILGRPEYSGARLEATPTWAGMILDWIEQFERWIEGLYASSPVGYWLLLFALIALVLGLLAHITWSVAVALRAGPDPDASVSDTRPARDLAAEARQLAARGRHLDAAHQLLLACLQRAARSGLIELRPDHTNRIVRRALEASSIPGDLRVELDELIGATERVWFRTRDDEPELYARWIRAYDRLCEVTR